MIWFFILIGILVCVPLYDKGQEHKCRQKWEQMDVRREFQSFNISEYASLKNKYDNDWYSQKWELYPKELIPALKNNPLARKQYAEIKIAQTQWKNGGRPSDFGWIINRELWKANPHPDLQYAAFMRKYAPGDNNGSVSE